MLSLIRRFFGRESPKEENIDATSSAYRFEMVELAVEVLREIATEILKHNPPDLPENLANTRGWTIRFEGIHEYCNHITTKKLEHFVTQLSDPIRNLNAYVQKWKRNVSRTDPLLRSYKIMPGDVDAVENVRILLSRAIDAQKIAFQEIRKREKVR